LPPYQYYSAGIAAYVNGNNWMQDNFDVWNNNMDLAGITNKGVVGFKYFGFGGLDKFQNGLNPFEAAKKGDGTTINLNITPSGKGAFRIHVMLDGPYANNVWNGKEIAVFDVPDNAQQKPQVFKAPVPEVEGLKGKHAIYLVVEGPEIQQPENQRAPWQQQNRNRQQRPQGLFDLHGIGFTKQGATINVPIVPTVEIAVDGKSLFIPDTPIYATSENGYTEANHYQLYAPIKENSVITVKPSNSAVKYEIGKIQDGRAIVKCVFNEQSKIFLIN
jgi:hypothetical protein